MKKIFLLADDDVDDKELFQDALNEIDPSIKCYFANDGKEALDILVDDTKDRPRIIFLDINMPGMDGWECLSILKSTAEYKDIPVIMYSTSSHRRDIDNALDNGAFCFFTKPNEYSELKDILEIIAGNTDADLSASLTNYHGIRTKKSFQKT